MSNSQTTQPPLTPAYRVIGTRPVRHDGVEKVNGRALYGADARLPGLLSGGVLRSPLAHARIKRIDTRRAAALPGVKAVITSADLPPTRPDEKVDIGEGPMRLEDLRDNILAREKVLYRGHAVAAVAAVNRHVAEEALALIDVEYEALQPVLDVLDAMKPDAPRLHEGMTMIEFGEDSGKPGNVAQHVEFKLGDAAAAFEKAAHVVEREIRTATVHQGYIEPHNATALWSPGDTLSVWTSTQGAFTARRQLEAILDLPVSRINVVPMEIGGGFGGKIPVYLEPLAAILSRQTGTPVQLLMSRKDVFEGTGPTPGSVVRVKLGADAEGHLIAGEAWIAFEAGAFSGSPVVPGAMCVFSCYNIPNALVDGYDVVVNKPRSFAYRAPGSTQVAFATETAMDELAGRLGMDPIEIRLKNAMREGSRRVDGLRYPRIGCVETLEAARDHPHYKAALDGPNRGRGVATGYWFNVGLQSTVVAHLNSDGTVRLIEGSTDIGGTRTSIAMQFAEELGITAEEVLPKVADTDSIGYTDATGGSRTTYATGWAAIEAARDMKAQLIQRAARLWDIPPDQVTFDNGACVRNTEAGPGNSNSSANGSPRLSIRELAAKLEDTGGPVTGRATLNAEAGVGGSFATNIVDIEVDPETGKARILRFTAIQDAGKAIHPSYVEGQMQGGSVQGIGWALNEEYAYDPDGSMRNASFLDYRMPTCLDVPMIDTVIVEVPNPGHPYGVRGVGEASIAPPPAAIANAIANAIGIRPDRLPMKPETLLK